MTQFQERYNEIMLKEGLIGKTLGTLGLVGALAMGTPHTAQAAPGKSKTVAKATQTTYKPIDSAYAEKIVDAIYRVEGGEKTKHPYGILSVKTSDPRKVCLNTVKNNYIRWQKAGSKGDYLDYLADVYCPPSADPTGNKNWHKNIHALVK
jgi:hypothetical protein